MGMKRRLLESLKSARVRPYLGPLVVLAVALAVEALTQSGVPVPALGVIFLMAIVAAVGVSGAVPGLFATALAIAYVSYHYLDPGSGHHGPGDLARMLVFTVAAPVFALVLGRARQRIDRYVQREHRLRSEADTQRDRVTRILESITDGFITLDTEWRYTYVNEQAQRMIDSSRDELLGKTVWGVFPELVGTPVDQELRRAMESQVTVGFEYHYETLDAWYAIRAYPSPTALVIYLHEITDQKRAEAALRARTEQQAAVAELGRLALAGSNLSSLFDTAVQLLADTLHVPNVKVLELLPGGNELLLRAGVGWKPGLVGRITVEAGESQAGYTLARAHPVVVEDMGTERRFHGPDLLFAHGIVSGLSVMIGSPDHPFGVLGVHTTTPYRFTDDEVHFVTSVANVLADAIELTRSQSALRESEGNFRQLAYNIDEMFFITDPYEERVVYISPAYERIWGRSCESVYADFHSWLEAIHPDDRPRVEPGVKRALLGRGFTEPYEHEMRIILPDGTVRWVSSRVFPVSDEQGRKYRVAGIVQDITDRKAAEQDAARLAEEQTRRLQAESRVQARDEVLALVSHDLRSPLGNIRLAADVLTDQATEDEAADALAVIRRSAEHMGRLIQDLLDVSRIEAGGLSIERQRVEIGDLVTEACEELRSQAAARGMLIEHQVRDDVPAVWADRVRIAQVMTNLIGNAIKFGQDGGRITVRTEVVPEGARISVSNRGTPIPKEHLPHLFERFWQAQCGDPRGSGLGLPIVKGIVEAHGGHINVESDAVRGTTFCFTLPAHVRPQPGPTTTLRA